MEHNTYPVTWPEWEVVKIIGRGSYGTVYEIQRDILGDVEKAALKIIRIPRNSGDIEELRSEGYDDVSITSRFQSYLNEIVGEYKVMSRMKGHRNIVLCDDVRFVQHDDGIGWDISIKMELLTPILKLQQLQPEHLNESEVIRLGIDICRALEECKREHIIHRDIKPQNIFISKNGDYKLGDFGIAKAVEKTTGGTKIGTYKYMAPEVYNNQPYGASADLYSLGMVLYWFLNNRRVPFLPLPPATPSAADEEAARERRYSGEEIQFPAHGSAELKRIILKACAFSPSQRYSTPLQMRQDLEKLIGTQEVQISTRVNLPNDDVSDFSDTSTIGAFGDKPTDISTLTSRAFPPKHGNKRKKRQKRHGFVLAALAVAIAVVIGVFAGGFLFHKHEWTEASCESPQQCITCGELHGDPAEHEWKAATCLSPQICVQCGETQGNALEHVWEDATYSKPETCKNCGQHSGAVLSSPVSMGSLYIVGLRTDGKVEYTGENLYGEIDVGMWDNIITIDAGWKHTVGLRTDGTVVATGLNEDGQCDLDSWSDIIAISAGYSHTVGVKNDGTVLLSGTLDMMNPDQIDLSEWTNIVSVSSGTNHIVGLRADGTVVAAGSNYNMQCEVSDWEDIIAIAAGGDRTYGLRADGTVVFADWGAHGYHPCTEWTDIVAISASSYGIYGVRADGTLAFTEHYFDYVNQELSTWTDLVAISADLDGIAGLRTNGTVVACMFSTGIPYNTTGWRNIGIPQNANLVGQPVSNNAVQPSAKVTGSPIAAGTNYTLMVAKNGSAVSIGQNDYNQGNVSNWKEVVDVDAGWMHSVGLLSDGSVVACGTNQEGQCNVADWSNIVDVDVGWLHTVACQSDGTVVATGNNQFRQCDVSSWTDIIAVSAGFTHTVGLKADGTLVAVGENSDGECDVSDIGNVKAIYAGVDHTIALHADGTVTAVGGNDYGECDVSQWQNIIAISAASSYTLGLKEDGTIVVAGSGLPTSFNPAAWSNIVAIAAGQDHAIALRSDGMLLSVGRNRFGECDTVNLQNIALPGEAFTQFSVEVTAFESAKPISISGGCAHTAILRSDGTVFIAGVNNKGQCDTSHWKDITAVSAGEYHTLGLREDGTVLVAGENEFGQCSVSDWSGIIAISAGTRHSAGLRADGTVVAVGENKDGQCNVSDWRNIVAVETGYKHTVGLRADGTVVATGLNAEGQCNVSGWTDIVAISSEGWHTVGLKSDGSVVAVGRNKHGQCNVSDWSDIIDIAAEGWHTVGLRSDGTVVAAGFNETGMCNISAWEDVIAIAAGNDHTLGLKSDGSIYALGDNHAGQCNFSGWTVIGTGTAAKVENVRTGIITGNKVNIRENPGTANAVVGSYKKGDYVLIVESDGDWIGTEYAWVNRAWVKSS